MIFDQHAVSGEEDVDFAVDTARKAFKAAWVKFSGERGHCLYKFADLLQTDAEEALYYESIWENGVVDHMRGAVGCADDSLLCRVVRSFHRLLPLQTLTQTGATK